MGVITPPATTWTDIELCLTLEEKRKPWEMEVVYHLHHISVPDRPRERIRWAHVAPHGPT
jgi:hypothetical protein